MKPSLLVSILIIFLLSNCRKENNDPNAFQFQAEVLGSNLDCGVFAIRFTSNLDQVNEVSETSETSAIYIARNLPEELQQPGIKIRLNIRKIKDTELGACKAMGPSYPWLYVIKAVKE